MISSELPELIGMSDRIVVMHEGRIAGQLSRDQFSEEAIMVYAAGLGKRLCESMQNMRKLECPRWEKTTILG